MGQPSSRRNYRQEYDKYQSSKSRIKYRSKLNSISRAKGTYGNGDNKDVSHIDNNPKNFSKKNLKLENASSNKSRGAKKCIAIRKAKKKKTGVY